MTQKHDWSYNDRPGKTALAAAGALLSIPAAVILYSHDFITGSYTFLLIGMFAAWFFFRLSRNTIIEIDLEKGMVIKKEKLLFSEKLSAYPLRDFSEVKISQQGAFIEEGYGVLRYGIKLEGSVTSLDVYSTEDEQQCRMILHMLAQYLSLPRDRIQGDGADTAPTGSDA